MTLPDDGVLELLDRDFVVGWRDIGGEEFCGESRGYARVQTALGTTNGAGGRNVQLLVLAPDLTVLHALPGFWHPEDLQHELRFALMVDRLWRDEGRSRDAKEAMYRRLLDRHARRSPALTTARSAWQHFDQRHEFRLAKTEPRDTVLRGDDGSVRMKPLNQLCYERLASRPLRALDAFGLAGFVDYGLRHYDNNRHIDGVSRRFRKNEVAVARRDAVRAKEERLAARHALTRR
ncbi:MAG: hypothetical protein AAF628_22530 [Planctomycetota bacterium]